LKFRVVTADISIHPPKSMLEVRESLPEGTLCQLINNKLVMSPAPKDIDQVILNKINIALSKYLEKSNAGEVRIAPYSFLQTKYFTT
jgi:hypothetical protein